MAFVRSIRFDVMISKQVGNRSKVVIFLGIEGAVRKPSRKFWSEKEFRKGMRDRIQNVSFLGWVWFIHSVDKK